MSSFRVTDPGESPLLAFYSITVTSLQWPQWSNAGIVPLHVSAASLIHCTCCIPTYTAFEAAKNFLSGLVSSVLKTHCYIALLTGIT